MENYITGYIFQSGSRIVIDAGKLEYPISTVGNFEIWNGSEFVPAILDHIKVPEMSGTKARFKVTT
ncbi:hypothetical protein ACFQI7_28250 [Paenibacillus allorhizosphaerae]|uniref:Uncharacterized protein n=1 Tax=Paenibacillus allorhizosphaerae TaxID=2849866 RepID=A0ABM8VNF3_9BACL|nr:hypothetical protein [Paenibacillus allorhizosphaerae]CAG7651409.1 hypothetical protein PAECIP111802_04956 [Paenibacillus allorhizosphaerae]